MGAYKNPSSDAEKQLEKKATQWDVILRASAPSSLCYTKDVTAGAWKVSVWGYKSKQAQPELCSSSHVHIVHIRSTSPFPSPEFFPAQKCHFLSKRKNNEVWNDPSDNSARRGKGENQHRVQRGNNSRDRKQASINQQLQPWYFWVLRSSFPTKSLSVPEMLPFIKPCAKIQGCPTVQCTCAVLFTCLESNCAIFLLACQQWNPSLRTDLPGWVNAVKNLAIQPQNVHECERIGVFRGPTSLVQPYPSLWFPSREPSMWTVWRRTYFALFFKNTLINWHFELKPELIPFTKKTPHVFKMSKLSFPVPLHR